jgi:hypothetical protein
LVNVTVKLLFASTVIAVVSVWLLPEELVANRHETRLAVASHPDCAELSPESLNPAAYVVLVGRLTPVIVTGNEFGFVIWATTSPLPPGNNRLDGEGDATALMVMFETLADWACPCEPDPRPTIQLVAA